MLIFRVHDFYLTFYTEPAYILFARPLKLAAMFFCAPAQNHKIGNTGTYQWVLRSHELTPEK